MKKTVYVILVIIFTGIVQKSYAQKSAKELALELANPVSSLISVPFQNSTDLGIGDYEGTRNILNIQPVIPVGISKSINLITRIILPVVAQQNITGLSQSESGLGDAVVSMFLNPAASKGGFTWGLGPVFLVPTATNDAFATKKFGTGPTGVALYQSGGSTVGGLVNQIWSVAGDENQGDVNQLYFQPFYSYNWESGAGLAADFEIVQNWKAKTTNIWFIPTISAVSSFGNQKVQFIMGPRISIAAPDNSKAKFGVRGQLVFLFPR
jgi:hypothetical protein